MPDLELLTAVFEEARRLVDDPENNFDWSFWEDREAAVRELDWHLEQLRAGDLPRIGAMQVLFAPTGPLQEVSLSSGWGPEFIALADRFDQAVANLGGEICRCLIEPIHISTTATELGMDPHFADVSVLTCPSCGRLWLRYFYENEAFSRSGRWFLGEVTSDQNARLTAENAKATLEGLEWYFYGGSYFDGRSGRASGSVLLNS